MKTPNQKTKWVMKKNEMAEVVCIAVYGEMLSLETLRSIFDPLSLFYAQIRWGKCKIRGG